MPRCQDAMDLLTKQITMKMWQANGLMMLDALLLGVVVGVGTCAPRYRHHPLIRFLFLGATTMFLPILSVVAGTIANLQASSATPGNLNIVAVSRCVAKPHISLVLIWTGLIVTIAVNASTVTATDPREGMNSAFPMVLFVNAVWVAYLIFSTTLSMQIRHLDLVFYLLNTLTFSKLGLRCCVFLVAGRSVGFGRNPRLIAGHMDQVDDDAGYNPSALVVSGEHAKEVEMVPRGYRFKNVNESTRLVTLDRVWKLPDLESEYKDLCFSFSLFKLLRCRFAKYTILDAGLMKVQKLFRDTYLQDKEGLLLSKENGEGNCGHERVFRVVADELSFIHDYYNSSLPIAYSNPLFPFISILLSLLSICYCSFMFVSVPKTATLTYLKLQLQCQLTCIREDGVIDLGYTGLGLNYGSIYIDSVPAYLVVALLLLSEMRDIAVYVCSNWTKVALICNYTKRTAAVEESVAGERSGTAPRKWITGFVLKYCRCKPITNSWEDSMNQCSILAGSRRSRSRCTVFMIHQIQQLLPPPIQEKIKVHKAVKGAIFKALIESRTKSVEVVGPQGLKHIRPPSSPICGLSICHANGTADIILAWHVATSIFEVKDNPKQPETDDKIAATRLSCYCAYLVACHPELLPDDDIWCQSQYKDAMENADIILADQPASSSAEDKYHMLVKLCGNFNHAVLKEGAALGEELVQGGKGWPELADFWANMLLYVAPSENLDGHADAIARGGELITLVWAMLAHDGIVARVDKDTTSTRG